MAQRNLLNQGFGSGPAGERRVEAGTIATKCPKDTNALRVALVGEVAGRQEGVRKVIAMHAPRWTLEVCQLPGSALGHLAHRVSEGVTKNDNGARPTPPPDAVLVVLGEGGLSGFQRIRKFKAVWPATPIVVVAKRLDAADVAEALAAGACGYLVQPVPPHELLNAIREAALGWPALCREAEVAMLCLIRCAGEGASGALTRQEHQIVTYLAQCPLLNPGSPASLHKRCSRSSRCLSALSEREERVVQLLESGMVYKEIEDRLHLSHSLVNKLSRRIFKKLDARSRAEAVNHWRDLVCRKE
ncbi:MAG: LuxR C-terminal-related transcriptional regulator [Limisphaerales bacterium]